MASTLDAQTTESKARALLDNRINSVRTLVTARQSLDDLREQIPVVAGEEICDDGNAIEGDDVKAYRAALTDGWSADELRKLGLDEPEKKQRVRRRAAPRKTTATEPANTSQPAAADAANETSS